MSSAEFSAADISCAMDITIITCGVGPVKLCGLPMHCRKAFFGFGLHLTVT